MRQATQHGEQNIHGGSNRQGALRPLQLAVGQGHGPCAAWQPYDLSVQRSEAAAAETQANSQHLPDGHSSMPRSSADRLSAAFTS